MTTPEGVSHYVNEATSTRAYDGRFFARCNAEIVSGSLTDEYGVLCLRCESYLQLRHVLHITP